MAARELSKAGKKVVILEARNRIGGRIWPLPKEEFGYMAEAGAEFVHGEAPLTKSLLQEAGLTYVSMDGDDWSMRSGQLTKNVGGVTNDPRFLLHQDEVKQKLNELKEDMPIANFLGMYFSDEKYAELRDWVTKMVEGYDAAEPSRISTFSLREEWLGGEEWLQGRIKEGYGALLNYLISECKNNGVDIRLNKEVKSVEMNESGVNVKCVDGEVYEAQQVIITLALPTLDQIKFNPPLPEKMEAAEKIGFGNVIKLIFKFRSEWWLQTPGTDFGKMMFMLATGPVTVWWTQYPDSQPVLTGWIPGPRAYEFSAKPAEDIIEAGLASLSEIFKIDRKFLNEQFISAKAINWPADPFSKGAYSYTTPESEEAYEELIRPVNNRIYFAGEALCNGKETATVEGALASGKETAERIITTKI